MTNLHDLDPRVKIAPIFALISTLASFSLNTDTITSAPLVNIRCALPLRANFETVNENECMHY